MCNTRIPGMTLLTLRPLIGSLQARDSVGSTVHPRKEWLMCTVIPFEGWVVTILDPTDGMVAINCP
jgi:hypothetical protein